MLTFLSAPSTLLLIYMYRKKLCHSDTWLLCPPPNAAAFTAPQQGWHRYCCGLSRSQELHEKDNFWRRLCPCDSYFFWDRFAKCVHMASVSPVEAVCLFCWVSTTPPQLPKCDKQQSLAPRTHLLVILHSLLKGWKPLSCAKSKGSSQSGDVTVMQIHHIWWLMGNVFTAK